MLKDIQSQPDGRQIDIDQVGIRDLTYPIIVKDRSKGSQNTIADIKMSVNLPHNFKGTHMSRFVEILNRHHFDIGIGTIKNILRDMQDTLDAQASHIEIRFRYFVEKKAPSSAQPSLMDYECTLDASMSGDDIDLIACVRVPVLSVCPCSKEISKYGAHNQRSYVEIKVRSSKLVWIEELIEYAESSASSPLYTLLKRDDEKYVTEHSYENPVFVEDIVRGVTQKLDADGRIVWFEVSSVNMESIHNHNAWAVIKKDKR